MNKDYYKILGITEFDSAENIKSAYRKLARKFHPDIAGNSAENLFKFKEINEAYEILSNNIKKEEYDKARKFYNYAKEGAKSNSATQSYNKTTTSKPETNFNWQNFFYKPKKHSENKTAQKGDNIESEVEISLIEAIEGCSKTINLLKTDVCQHCQGRKFVNGTICNKCHGKGEFTTYKKFNVKIPAGIKNGSKIRLAGEGNSGKNGGANGDIYLIIKIKEPNQNNNSLNIYKTISITPFEAVLGCELNTNTPEGVVSFKLAPNTQNGQKIKLSKCGLVQNNKIGDMIITVEIQIQKNLSTEEINLYKKLSEISKSNIRDEFYDRQG